MGTARLFLVASLSLLLARAEQLDDATVGASPSEHPFGSAEETAQIPRKPVHVPRKRKKRKSWVNMIMGEQAEGGGGKCAVASYVLLT